MRQKTGFTLIELMIIVAVIGIMAVIAVPKFAGLLTKARESTVKSQLGKLRSALTIYYSDNSEYAPANGSDLSVSLAGKYLDEIPEIGIPTEPIHPRSRGIGDATNDASFGPNAWVFERDDLRISVNCTHNDSKGTIWSTH